MSGGHAGVGRGRRVPGVGHRTGLAQGRMFWGETGTGERELVFTG